MQCLEYGNIVSNISLLLNIYLAQENKSMQGLSKISFLNPFRILLYRQLFLSFITRHFIPSPLSSTPTLDGKTKLLNNLFFICPLEEHWLSASPPHSSHHVSISGLGQGAATEGAGKAHTIFCSGNLRSSTVNKQTEADGHHIALVSGGNLNFANSMHPTHKQPQKMTSPAEAAAAGLMHH